MNKTNYSEVHTTTVNTIESFHDTANVISSAHSLMTPTGAK